MLERLVSAGANVDLVNLKRHSALQIAANLGHLRCVEILLQNDCDVNLMVMYLPSFCLNSKLLNKSTLEELFSVMCKLPGT